jgi:hypothetical protein
MTILRTTQFSTIVMFNQVAHFERQRQHRCVEREAIYLTVPLAIITLVRGTESCMTSGQHRSVSRRQEMKVEDFEVKVRTRH